MESIEMELKWKMPTSQAHIQKNSVQPSTYNFDVLSFHKITNDGMHQMPFHKQ